MEILKLVCSECQTINTIKVDDFQASYPCTQCQAELDDPFPIEVSDENCTLHITHDDTITFVDFYSRTCGPCMAMYDDYEDAALGYGLKVRFLKIDADKYQPFAHTYNVGALPTIIAFKDAKEISRMNRQLSRVELTLWADSLL